MQKISIRSFGPIREAELPIQDMIILNGPQASGKSTISKAIFFFKSLPEIIFQAMYENSDFLQDFDKNLVVACRRQLISIFGTTKHFNDFYLKYTFSPMKNIKITKEVKTGHARVVFSSELRNALRSIAQDLRHLRSSELPRDVVGDYLIFKTLYEQDRQKLFHLNQTIREAFEEERQPLFIPAGRSLVSTLSGELKGIDSYDFDYLMQEFVRRIFYQRELFSKDLEEIVEDRKKLTTIPIDFKRVKRATELAKEILRGRYRYENGEERILIDDENYIKIKFASSGQQEALWILLLLFVSILNNQDGFVVVEEPEAHLFPETQYQMIKLIGVLASRKGNQVVTTTHSPYIMAAANNLLLANQVSAYDNKQASLILPDVCRLEAHRTSAYFVENGRIQNILDDETGVIDPSFLDGASETINADLEELLKLEVAQ
jgi:AAA15 family ATPase/GTPase